MKIQQIRKLASDIRASADYTDAGHAIAELDSVITAQEKQHRRFTDRRDYRPIAIARDLFLVRTIGEAFKTIGRRRTIPVHALAVRRDYLLALSIVARYPKALTRFATKAELIKAAEACDYCVHVVKPAA